MAVRGPLSVEEAEFFAAYPFLPGAEALSEELAASVRGLIEETALERARELGRARIRAALEDPWGEAVIAELDLAEPGERFLSFQYARLILGAAGTPAPARRWAVSEAKRSGLRLGRADPSELFRVAGRLGVDFAEIDGRIGIPVPQYLKLATPIRDAAFRLPQQPILRGRVLVASARAARLLEEGIRRQLSEPVELAPPVRERIEASEGGFLEEVRRRAPAPKVRAAVPVGALQPAKFPPCIRKMRRTLEEGENLSHPGRFALAAFLHRVGADAETIVDAFRGAPDFDEGITRYQVDHITRHDGGAGYDPPECETLRSHGLCAREGDPAAPDEADRRRDPLCFEPFLRHPLRYYEIRTGAAPGGPARARDRPTAPG